MSSYRVQDERRERNIRGFLLTVRGASSDEAPSPPAKPGAAAATENLPCERQRQSHGPCSMSTALNTLPAWTPPDNLLKMNEPRHRVLAEFMGGCSPDPATRTIATTALVLSLWQVAGWRMTHRPPSMLLLNATESTPDPIDRMADTIASYRGRKGPAEKGVGQLVGATPSQADTAMRMAVMRRQQLGKPVALNAAGITQQVQRFHTARTTAHGEGPTRGYSNAWDEQLGLITDDDNQVILRLDAPRDHAAFRRDVIENPESLREPQGIGGMLQMVRKSISVSGSLTSDLWDGRLAHSIVELGLPPPTGLPRWSAWSSATGMIQRSSP